MKEIEEDWNPMEDYEKYKCELLDEICGKQEKNLTNGN